MASSAARAVARRAVRLSAHAFAVGALVSVFSCDGDDSTARVVDPSFVEPCRYFGGCSDHGECRATEENEPLCLCEVGYASLHCEACEPDFHRNALNQCVSDKTCAEQPNNVCGAYGSCREQGGVIACTCEDGYAGPRCNVCATGHALDGNGKCRLESELPPRDAGVKGMPVQTLPDAGPLDASLPDGSLPDATLPDATLLDATLPDATLPDATVGDASLPDATRPDATLADASVCPTEREDFESGTTGWPSGLDQCNSAGPSLVLSKVTLNSALGAALPNVWLCAPTQIYPMTTRHVFVEARSGDKVAQLVFKEAVSALRFDFASRRPNSALLLEVLADGSVVGRLNAAPHGLGTISLTLATPAKTFALRSLPLAGDSVAYEQLVAVDNIEYRRAQCQ